MAILKEYRCAKHGDFESRYSVCPHGCLDVERIHTKAPAVVGRRTRNIDATLEQIARDGGYTDLSNKRGSLAASLAPPEKPVTIHPLVQKYMDTQQQMFGGTFTPTPDGSFWATGTSFSKGAGKPGGELTTMLGVPNPHVDPVPVIDPKHKPYGTRADLPMPAAAK